MTTPNVSVEHPAVLFVKYSAVLFVRCSIVLFVKYSTVLFVRYSKVLLIRYSAQHRTDPHSSFDHSTIPLFIQQI